MVTQKKGAKPNRITIKSAIQSTAKGNIYEEALARVRNGTGSPSDAMLVSSYQQRLADAKTSAPAGKIVTPGKSSVYIAEPGNVFESSPVTSVPVQSAKNTGGNKSLDLLERQLAAADNSKAQSDANIARNRVNDLQSEIARLEALEQEQQQEYTDIAYGGGMYSGTGRTAHNDLETARQAARMNTELSKTRYALEQAHSEYEELTSAPLITPLDKAARNIHLSASQIAKATSDFAKYEKYLKNNYGKEPSDSRNKEVDALQRELMAVINSDDADALTKSLARQYLQELGTLTKGNYALYAGLRFAEGVTDAISSPVNLALNTVNDAASGGEYSD